MDYTIDDLIKELMEDKDWDFPEELKGVIVANLATTIFEK